MDDKQLISQLLERLLDAALPASRIEELLEAPRNAEHGDLAFPCFALAKQLRKAPQAIAEELAAKLDSVDDRPPEIASSKAIGPYLNFVLDKSSVAAAVVPGLLDGTFFARRPDKGEKVMVEYSQPNTHKAFHVGHIRCAALGDSVARLQDWAGYEVVPTNYIGDEGTHVARCLWYLMKRHKGEIPETNRGEFLGKLYTKATEILDLATYSRAPYPGVVVARVLRTEGHPKKKDWTVVELETVDGRKTVVCGISGYSQDDLVAYAPPNTHVNGKFVGLVDREGIQSEGMICAEEEIGLSEDAEKVALLPQGTPIGTSIIEVFRREGALPDGTPVLDELARLQEEVSGILQGIESGDAETTTLWQKTKDWSMNEFYEIYDWLNCRFDHYFFESECGEPSKEIVREFQEKGVFVESDGAIGADLREVGLGFCVLIKRDGTALYATRDLALAKIKFEDFRIDRSLYVVDAGQKFHFQQVFQCLELMGYEQAKNCFHLDFAQVVRPDGKMSSRKGNVILFSELKARLLEKITSEFLEKYRGEWSESEIEETAYRIALATIRYGMLNQDNNSQIVFDIDEWTARTGNTGPYLMYAFARIRSILRDTGDISAQDVEWELLTHPAEVELLMHLKGYPETVERAADLLSPHLISGYLYDLSKKFSRMYKDCSVLHAESEQLKAARASLVEGVSAVLRHGLGLLGIETVERM